MYLIDTSVWIDYLRDKENIATKLCASILDKKTPFGITSIIYQEILQGAASSESFTQLQNYFKSQRFFHPQHSIETYQSAATIYFLCRRKGFTIRSTIDCLIAQIAIEHNLILLHHDKDFEKIKHIAPKLQIAA